MANTPNVGTDELQTGESGRGASDRAPAWLIASVIVAIAAVLVLGGLVASRLMSRDVTQARARDARLLVFERAVAERPDDLSAVLRLAFVYQQNELYGPALAEYKKVLSAEPGNLGALYNTGLIQLRTGKGTAAEQTLTKVLVLSPAHALATYALGTYYADAGEFDRALEVALPAAETHPDNADLQLLVGRGLENTGRPKEAAARYRAALKLVPDMAEAKTALKRVGSGQ